MDAWVVSGSGNKGALKEKLESGVPGLLFLMDGFNLTPDLVNIQMEAARRHVSIDFILGEHRNEKAMLMEELCEESLKWIRLMERIHDQRLSEKGRHTSVFVLKDGLELFHNMEGVKDVFSLDKMMKNNLGYWPMGSNMLKLCPGYHSVQEIRVYSRDGQIFIIWPKVVHYQGELDRFTGKDTVLITDGPVTALQIEKAKPCLILSPFPVDVGIPSVRLKGITEVKLK